MPSCPSDEALTGLLADALTPVERGRLARQWKDALLARKSSRA